jgi:hypothetical protein
MLPLASPSPRFAHELAEALTQGLAAQGVMATAAVAGRWPELEQLRIDFTHIALSKPLALQRAAEMLRIAQVEVAGKPVLIEGVPVEMEACFAQVRAGIAASEPAQLVMLGADGGSLRIEIGVAEAERALQAMIARLAAAQGATIKAVRLRVDSPGERVVDFSVEATVKVFLATTTLTVHGRVEIDDALTARIAALSLSGEGMMASLAQGFLAPHLAAWRGREVALGAGWVAGLRVSDLHVSAGEALKLEASFAAA